MADFVAFLDLLFSIIFGTSFAFKLGIMHDKAYGWDPLPHSLQYAAYLLYSIAFVWLYWFVVRSSTLLSQSMGLLAIAWVIIESLAPYPAFELAVLVNRFLKWKKILSYTQIGQLEHWVGRAFVIGAIIQAIPVAVALLWSR